MKVLMLHNRYKIMGGEDVSTNAEYTLLKEHGVDIETLILTNDIIEDEPISRQKRQTIRTNG